MKTAAKIIAYILIVLALVAAVGLIYKYTNGFNEDFKTFYVEYGGKKILTTESKLALEKPETHTFTVKYTFDNEKSEPKDYNVKIVPNVERDFDYTVNGEKYLFSKTGELTEAFALNKEKTQFSVTIPAEFNLQTALQSINGGKTVVVPEEAETNNAYPYRLVVSSYNEKVTFNIDFKIITPDITDITLNPDGIIFGGKDTPYTPTTKKYSISYDCLGWASMEAISLNCPSKAAAGEELTFKATVKPEYAAEYKISRIVVRLGSGEEYIEDLQGNNGTYTFTMPDTETMENEINESYITLMFYIIPVDI